MPNRLPLLPDAARRLILPLAATGLIAAGLAGCGAEAQENAAPPPPEVTVAKPIVRDVEQFSEHTGRFVPAQSVEVRPRVSGYLQAVHFREGQYVRKGQLLFTIDAQPFRAASDQRAAEVAQTSARLSLAESQLARAESLRAVGAISEEEFDNRRQAVASARAARQAAQAAHRADNLNLGYTRVYAPISGRVSDTRVDAGNLVQQGESVLTRIVALDPIHFEFSAAEGLLAGTGGPRLKGDEAVAVKLEGETDFVHPGRLDFVDNAIDPATGTIKGRAVFRNDGGGLVPGQYGRLRVLTPAAAPSLLLPETAINSDQSRKFVLVVNTKNTVEYRPVTLGAQLGGLRVVATGLKGDERVIVNGLQRAMPGMPVKPVAAPARTAARAQTASKAG
ncbi:MAG TPA: efflux RND transporter periplasmic adaptor subunit [Caulobacteraceae bacterium]|nr:efflux RND transporter periplasmic adaptor subunit [Caulobacteraceae bacterium]